MSAMLQEVFYWVFNMSITAAISGAAVLLVRMIRKIPRRLTVLLWLIPFFRMTVPLGLNSPYGLMSLVCRITGRAVAVQSVLNIDLSMMNMTMAADSYFPVTYKTDALEQVFNAASAIWITVLLAILLMLGTLYFTTLKEMKDAKPLRDNICISEKIVSPAVYGIIKPKIILPASYAGKNIEFVLLHEKMHIRRGDNLWRVIAFLTAAVHWFNPLSWIFLKLFLADTELSCDECVLMKLDSRSRDYARSLLESKESTDIFASSFGGAKIRTRIENILSFKKMTWFSLVGFIIIIAVIFYVLLTNAG